MAYEIGYKRPPKARQFRKGQSGNPKGRPKGSNNFLTLLEKELGQPIVVNDNGKRKTISRMQAMVKRIVNGALQGDTKSMLTLVEILRRTGRFEDTAIDQLLPDNYEDVLNSYVAQRQNAANKQAARTPPKR